MPPISLDTLSIAVHQLRIRDRASNDLAVVDRLRRRPRRLKETASRAERRSTRIREFPPRKNERQNPFIPSGWIGCHRHLIEFNALTLFAICFSGIQDSILIVGQEMSGIENPLFNNGVSSCITLC
jgi:hypothetical protein